MKFAGWLRERGWVVLGLVVLMAGGTVAYASHGKVIPPQPVFLARADNPVDALAASSAAGTMGGSVLLTGTDDLHPDAREGIRARDPGVVIIAGGTAAISQRVEQQVRDMGYRTLRVAGENRMDTARQLSALPKDTYGIGRPLLTDASDPSDNSATTIAGDAYVGGYLEADSFSINGAVPFTSVRREYGFIGSGGFTTVSCPDGWRVTGGGWQLADGSSVTITGSYPSDDLRTWWVTYEGSGTLGDMAYAVCAA